jgi:RNA polymerase sigma factor (sigma-70 family)
LQYTIDEQLSQIHDRGLSDEVMYLLRGLTERQKEIIYFRFVNDMSFEEISEVMEVTIQSARNLLTRSLVKIRKESLLLFLLLESIPYTV